MSAQTTVNVVDRFSGKTYDRLSSQFVVFEADKTDDDGKRRICIAVITGCSSTHVCMTREEVNELIAALQEQGETIGVVAEAA